MRLVPASVTAAVLAALVVVAPTGGQPPVSPLPADMIAAHADLVGAVRGCFGPGWGARGEYLLLSWQDVYRRAAELSALHAQRIQAWERCAHDVQPRLTAYRSSVEELGQYAAAPATDAEGGTVESAWRLFDQSVVSVDHLVRTAFPMIIALEKGYHDYFEAVRRLPPPTRPGSAKFPPILERLEREVLTAIRAHASAGAAYLEGLYALFPSPQTRARMRVATLLDVVYRALDRVSEPDGRSYLQRLRGFRQAARVAQFIAYEEANDPDLGARLPGAAEKYRAMLVLMMHLQEDIAQIEDLSRGTGHQPSDASRLSPRLRQALGRVERAVDRIEALAYGIDTEARRLPLKR